MADLISTGMPLADTVELEGVQKSQKMNCLICDANIVSHNGYSLLYTVLPSGGSLLSDNINKVLKRDVDVITTRSSVICNRCFSLFDELAEAESKCVSIKKEIESSYLKTCEIHNEEYPIDIRGIACQTDDAELSSAVEEDNKPDLKLKIALPKKKRGRPKSETPKRKSNLSLDNMESFDGFESSDSPEKSKRRDKQGKKDADRTSDTFQETRDDLRRTRSSGRSNIKTKNISTFEPADETFEWKEDIEDENSENPTQEPDFMGVNVNVNVKVEGEDKSLVFSSQDASSNGENDDDDFEWKEDPLDDFNDPSESDDDKDDKSGNEEDWQSSGSKDCKKKHKKKKKRKRGDRRGERAFMVPVHECPQCGKKWRTVTELKSHIASHSDLRPFVCEICGQAYKMKKALDIHIGMHNGIHPFVCSYCNKSFTQKVGLEKHLPIHTGVARFQCDLCGKRFIHQKSFNIHKMTHTGEKNIHCPICKLAVFSQSHLKRHYRVHTGERPYGCAICGKKFAEKYNLNAHTRIHDPNSAGEGRRRCHTCPICGVTYDRKQKMADHLSSAHYLWQTQNNIELKTEDFYNMEMQGQGQHQLQMQGQQQSVLQGPSQQQQQQQQQQPQQQQQQPHVHQQQQSQISLQQQQPPVTQAPHVQTAQMAQPQHHHQMAHHQQHNPHHMQQHHAQSAAPHHILVTQHQLQQTLQTHLAHHPVAAAATVVATATAPSLQPINSVFQLVSVQSTTADPSAAHHNRMNSVTASMAVPTL